MAMVEVNVSCCLSTKSRFKVAALKSVAFSSPPGENGGALFSGGGGEEPAAEGDVTYAGFLKFIDHVRTTTLTAIYHSYNKGNVCSPMNDEMK